MASDSHPFPDSIFAPWAPDQNDGSYINPVIHADYPDLDATRTGDDFFLVASSLNCAPGLPILHSRDLVNWRLLNHALHSIPPREHYETPRHGEGVWSPAIRHYDGLFRLYYGDPDFGIYVTTAADPAGEWSEPVMVKAGKGLIDPCPFWDEDGSAWLIHGWALSRAGINNQLTLQRMNREGTMLEGEPITVLDENAFGRGWSSLEAPKLHKMHGHYWVFASIGGVSFGQQVVYRSLNIEGPYESRIVLSQCGTNINGPRQGAIVSTPGGETWFLHGQEKGIHGRVVHLQPVRWTEDGWPVIGTDPDTDGNGEPILQHPKPAVAPQEIDVPASSDAFEGSQLGPQWHWQANPQADWFSLTENAGTLLLRPIQTVGANLWLQPNLLLQRLPAPEFEVTTSLTLSGDTVRAGLLIFGESYGWIGLERGPDGTRLVLKIALDARHDGAEAEHASTPSLDSVRLRIRLDPEGVCHFAYCLAGETYLPFGPGFAAVSGTWVGAKIGIFAVGEPEGGGADFHWFAVSAPA